MEPISIPAFVINLQRRSDRLAIFMKRCPLKDVLVVSGFDAKSYENEDSEDITFFKKVKCKYPGESAVYISHLRVMKEIVNSGHKYGLIFEDDAEFCPGFLEKYQQILKEMPEDTHLLYIGGRFTSCYKMKEANSSKVTDHIVQHVIRSKVHDGWDIDRTAHAYIVSSEAAKMLLEYFNSLTLITRPIDELMLHYFLENKIPIYNSMPLLCHSPMVGDSDIRGSNKSHK
jgi:glycosyl transferase family 25